MMRRLILCLLLVLLASSMVLATGCRKKGTPTQITAAPTGEATDKGPEHPTLTQEPKLLSGENGPMQKVLFDYDNSAIRPDQMAAAEADAKFVLANPDMQIQVEGHADERGTVEYNLGLGTRRAEAVKDFLVSRGAKAENISVVSKGKEMPLDPGHNEAAWSKNRRVEFYQINAK
jgi:peptidoglycan-associated lipoprotein